MLSAYSGFQVQGLIALCSCGLPIATDSLSEKTVVSWEPAACDDDPHISSWGVFGELPDKTNELLAQCPDEPIALAIANALLLVQQGLSHGQTSADGASFPSRFRQTQLS